MITSETLENRSVARRLIRDASALRMGSGKIISSLLEETRWTAWNNALKNCELLRLLCGEPVGEGLKNETVEAFWHSARSIVSSQFGGFLVEPNDPISSPERLLELTREANTGDFQSFWKQNEGRPANSETLFPVRELVIVTLFRALLSIPKTPDTAQTQHSGQSSDEATPAQETDPLHKIRQTIAKGIVESLEGLPNCFPSRIRDDELPNRLQLLFRHELAASLRMAGFEPQDQPSSDILFDQLAKLLTRGTDRASALEVSLLLRLLIGRSLNSTSSSDPSSEITYNEAIAYVLTKQRTEGGRWTYPPTSRPESNPFLHHYTPLVYLLDLPTSFLAPHFSELTSAIERVLQRLKLDLDEHRQQIEQPTSSNGPVLARKLIIWLSVSTLVEDRLRDLLSVSVLEELGAITPDTELSWQDISDALHFKKNIHQGVINKWNSGSSQRPGAILVYGPPGTGKTTLAKVLAKELDKGPAKRFSDSHWRFLALDPADFARDGMDKIVANAEHLFSQLRQVRRCVVLLDEMEEFLRVRDETSSKESRLITTAFLPLLTEAVQSREIILVVATNFVGNIDAAVTRRGRFDLILPLGPPDKDSRQALLGKFKGLTTLLDLLAPDGETEEQREVRRPKTMALLGYFMMGYTFPEMKDFFRDLLDKLTSDRTQNLVELLWRIRCKRVPTALSGRAGCSWRTFADEAQRYARFDVSSEGPTDDPRYWREPHLPTESERQPDLPIDDVLQRIRDWEMTVSHSSVNP